MNEWIKEWLISETTSNICSTCCEINCPSSKNKPYTHEETESVSNSVSAVQQRKCQSNIGNHDDTIDANSTVRTEFQRKHWKHC